MKFTNDSKIQKKIFLTCIHRGAFWIRQYSKRTFPVNKKIHKIKETKAVIGTGENRLKIRCKVGPDPQNFNCTGA